MQTLSEYFEATRRRKGEFARAIGISATHLSTILSGGKFPSFATMCKIEEETGGAVPLSVWKSQVSGSVSNATEAAE